MLSIVCFGSLEVSYALHLVLGLGLQLIAETPLSQCLKQKHRKGEILYTFKGQILSPQPYLKPYQTLFLPLFSCMTDVVIKIDIKNAPQQLI